MCLGPSEGAFSEMMQVEFYNVSQPPWQPRRAAQQLGLLSFLQAPQLLMASPLLVCCLLRAVAIGAKTVFLCHLALWCGSWLIKLSSLLSALLHVVLDPGRLYVACKEECSFRGA